MALLLRRRGITRVRPLAGGLDEWRARGFALEAHSRPASPAPAA
ncbi:MAG: hypothetical protein U1B94_05140 [candidate division NC10 bacterium]|nr:hypothetical protein [candidate division NC10 bacterium]